MDDIIELWDSFGIPQGAEILEVSEAILIVHQLIYICIMSMNCDILKEIMFACSFHKALKLMCASPDG